MQLLGPHLRSPGRAHMWGAHLNPPPAVWAACRAIEAGGDSSGLPRSFSTHRGAGGGCATMNEVL